MEKSRSVENFLFREKRYQWIINTLLVVMGFMAGVLFEAERMKTQVVTNTVEISLIRDTLDQIQIKLDTLIQERRPELAPAVSPPLES